MISIRVAIVLLLCAQYAIIAEGVKDDVCNGYFDYYDCILECYRETFDGFNVQNGDLCEGDLEVNGDTNATFTFAEVEKSLKCITEECGLFVPDSVCDDTCGHEEKWHWHPPPWKHTPWKPHPWKHEHWTPWTPPPWTPEPWTPPPWTPEPWTPPPWTPKPWTPPPWTPKPWTPPPWTPKPWTKSPWTPWKKPHHHHGGSSSAAAASSASGSGSGSAAAAAAAASSLGGSPFKNIPYGGGGK